MDRKDIDELINRWVNEPSFRQKMRSNPIKTLKDAGCQLNEGELKALAAIDWNLPDEELKSRVSHGM